MSDGWKFEPIKIKNENQPRMICYYDDFKKLRKKLIEEWKEFLMEECPQFNDEESENEAKKIINKLFGVKE